MNSNTMSIFIRQLTKENLQQIQKLDNVCMKKYNHILSGDVASKFDDQSVDKVHIYGIFHDKELVGYCTLDEYGTNNCLGSVLSNVMVLPAYQQKGIGSALVAFVLKKAPKPIYLCCLNNQFDFYRKFGFKAMGVPTEMMILE